MTHPNIHFEIHPPRAGSADDQTNWHYVYYADVPPIRIISFKGGGTRVLVYMKFLEIVHKMGLLKQVQEVGGSSSGSLAAAFAAIHYEDPARRTQALEEVMNCDRYDVYGESNGWKAYQVLTFPLLIISKPLEWAGKLIGKAADACNRFLLSKMLGIPLKIVSVLFGIASTITSPRFIPACINLISKGGVYRGDQVEKTIRNRIHKDVNKGLYDILKKLRDEGNEIKRNKIIDKIVEIGLGRREDGKLILTPEITLSHMHELALITDYQFKSYYTTGVRLRDKSLVELNHKNFPDMPFYRAPRISINFPRYYMPAEYGGETYIDGGAINNAPVNLATAHPVHDTHQEFDIKHDHLSRLNVRVEYADDYQNLLWNNKPEKGKFGKFIGQIITALVKKFAYDVDVFATDQVVTHHMKEHFAQRTLQIHDFGVGVMEENLSASRREKMDEEIEVLVQEYFGNHKDEKVTKRFSQPTALLEEMPLSVRTKLLAVLRDNRIKSEHIFIFPNKTPQELEVMRRNEIDRLTSLMQSVEDNKSTTDISRKLGFSTAAEHNNNNNNNVVTVTLSEDNDALSEEFAHEEEISDEESQRLRLV